MRVNVAASLTAFIVILGSLSPAFAQATIAIIHGTVIDGNGGEPVKEGVVLVRGDRIVAVGPAPAVQIPPGTRLIDATGKAVLPGLADMHVHLLGGWNGESADMLGYQRYLNALLYAGITTVLDTGNVLPYIVQMRDEVAAGRIVGPSIHIAGSVVDGPDPLWPPISIALASSAQIPGVIKQLKRGRVDIVKGYVGLPVRELTALVNAARAESLRVFVDVGQQNGTAAIARTGIAGFAHLGTLPVTDETVMLMRERQVASITTLAVYESNSRRRLADLAFTKHPLIAQTMPPLFIEELTAFARRQLSDRENAAAGVGMERLRTAFANAKRLFDAGILLAAGTDAPYPGDFLGEGLHRELELLVEAGLTPTQAITLATKNAAMLLNESGEWGTLSAGKRADVLVVTGDPTRRIGDTRNVDLVMHRGRVLDRANLQFDPKKDPGFRVSASVAAGTP
jgi:imidazolonepropionase-like amidohydrolase